MTTPTYAYGDFDAFIAWRDGYEERTNAVRRVIDSAYSYEEFGVMKGFGARIEHGEYGFFRIEKVFRDLGQAVDYARMQRYRFVVQRMVYCEAWQ